MDLGHRSSRSVSSTPVCGERAGDGGGGSGSGTAVGTIGSSRNNNSSSSIHSSPALPGYDVVSSSLSSSSAMGGPDADLGFPMLDIGGIGKGLAGEENCDVGRLGMTTPSTANTSVPF